MGSVKGAESRKDVVAVPTYVHGKEVKDVASGAGHVVERADNRAPLAPVPIRIARPPVGGMCREAVRGPRRVIEPCVAKQVLGNVQSTLDPDSGSAVELQIVAAGVTQKSTSRCTKILAGFVTLENLECTGLSVRSRGNAGCGAA